MNKYINLTIAAALFSMPTLSRAQDADEAVKRIVTFYQQMEENHKDWPQARTTRKEAGAPMGVEEAIWQNAEGHTRVEVVYGSGNGPVITQYTLDGDELVFVFKSEQILRDEPGAPWSVVEFRHYYENGGLIRSLFKRGTFKSGEEADMSKFKNNVVALDQVEQDYSTFLEEAKAVLARLQPRLKAPGGSKKGGFKKVSHPKLRQIEETEYFDGSLALFWGVEGDAAVEKDGDGKYYAEDPGAGIVNYVYDLKNQKIVGKTAGHHGSDRRHYSQAEMTTEVHWAINRQYLVQTSAGKQNVAMFAELYHLDLEKMELSGGLELLPVLKVIVQAKLNAADAVKLSEGGAIRIESVNIMPNSKDYDIIEMDCKFSAEVEYRADFIYECQAKFTLTPGADGGAPDITTVGSTVKKVKNQ